MNEPSTANRDLSVLRIRRDDDAGGRGRLWGGIAAGILLVALAAAGWTYRDSLLPAPKLETATVRAVLPGRAGGALTASGYVVAQRQSTLSPRASGRLDWLGADEGDRVRGGEVVARLQHDSQEAVLAEARAALVQARADLEEAKAALQLARADEARQQRLRGDGVNTARDLDAAVAGREQLEARVRALEAAIGAAEASVRGAEVDLENTNIRAPFDGILTERRAQLGEMLSAGAFAGQPTGGAVFVLADFGSLEVEADVSEANLAKVKLGAPARITLDAYPDAPFRGEVKQIVPTADRQRAIVQVKVRFLEPDERILPEMSAQVSFLDQPDAAGAPVVAKPMIPEGAVVRRGERTSAWVVRDGRASRRAIRVGPANGGMVEVLEGLQPGETVVVGAPDGLAEGTRVASEEG